MKPWFVPILLSAALLAGIGSAAGTALADANGHASCLGIEASSVSPPGSSSEEPGGAAQLSSEVRSFAGNLGLPPGALFSSIAMLHEGSHEACDEALG